MRLHLDRFLLGAEVTIGTLQAHLSPAPAPRHLCYTLEDAARRGDKVLGRTAIPDGIYEVALRRGSPLADKYDAAHKDITHDGMLWLQGVPGFSYVYLHVGNDEDDTEGCILVGEGTTIFHSPETGADGVINNSIRAYKAIYPMLRAAANQGDLTIMVTSSPCLALDNRALTGWQGA